MDTVGAGSSWRCRRAPGNDHKSPVSAGPPGPEPGRTLRILVVDDEPAMVGAVSALVGSAGHQVVTAYDGDTALRRLAEESPDLVLLDLAMPGRDGVDVIRVARRTTEVPIIILTGEADELAKVEALDAGADDYVTKPFGRQELLARIRAVIRRRESIPSPAAHRTQELRFGALVIDAGRFDATVTGRPLSLTRIEFALLAALAEADGRVVLHGALLAAGWHGERDPDPQWLKPHLARLRAKLEGAGGPLPTSIRGVGYRLE
ncbi:MAG: response regulator transcription factor [Chloroflexi bacterium]|nr:response regulator transcription factor [Chloroflexota bacterium]